MEQDSSTHYGSDAHNYGQPTVEPRRVHYEDSRSEYVAPLRYMEKSDTRYYQDMQNGGQWSDAAGERRDSLDNSYDEEYEEESPRPVRGGLTQTYSEGEDYGTLVVDDSLFS